MGSKVSFLVLRECLWESREVCEFVVLSDHLIDCKVDWLYIDSVSLGLAAVWGVADLGVVEMGVAALSGGTSWKIVLEACRFQ